MDRVLRLYTVLAILLVLVSLAHQSPLNLGLAEEIGSVIERAIRSKDAVALSTPLTNTSELGGEFGASKERHCHFHAGVEHCDGEQDTDQPPNCGLVKREYNVPLRWGMVAAVLVASALGVYGPIILRVNMPSTRNAFSILIKQFGTGVVVSTAFVHLFTHASLMFENECLGEIDYEATPAAILLFGVFVSFAVEFLSHRFFSRRQADGERQTSSELVNIFVLESGILFHSLLIGVTLVVTGDSFFVTLAVVIGFHQLFEGVALGSRIAELGLAQVQVQKPHRCWGGHVDQAPTGAVSAKKKFALASGFAFVTPLGMILGMAVLHRFNGNDPFTIVALGSLDAFSAGILVWTGVVEMWAKDWLEGGEMASQSNVRTGLGLLGLVSGMALMGLLGKWA
ncbi:zinc/iron transporter protein [Apiospora rasikravindrae]|uniref:Zinc/iron transporter protein n=1 Tax=Apiospora rasikravindrae TaxID=990691 RepID=A0ABR1TFY4_9PEZI